MYRIIKVSDGVELGITEAVNYIKIGGSGSFTTAEKGDAIGVAFESTAYNLAGHEEIEKTETVVVAETDGGATVSRQQTAINEMIQTILEG